MDYIHIQYQGLIALDNACTICIYKGLSYEICHRADLVHGAGVVHTVGLLRERGKPGEEKLNHVHQRALGKATEQLWRERQEKSERNNI